MSRDDWKYTVEFRNKAVDTFTVKKDAEACAYALSCTHPKENVTVKVSGSGQLDITSSVWRNGRKS